MPRLRPLAEKPNSPPPSPQPEVEATQGQDPSNILAPESQVSEPVAPEVIVDESPAPSEAEVALKKQLEALQNSEKQRRDLEDQLRRQHDEAVRQAQEYQANLQRTQKEAQDNEELALNSSLTAAKTAVEKAESDLQSARDTGDTKAEVTAFKAIAAAQNDISNLERGIEEMVQRKRIAEEQAKYASYVQSQQPQQDPRMALPHVKAWVEKNSAWFANPRLKNRIEGAFYSTIEDEHLEPYSREQIARIEEIVGMRPAPAPAQAEPEFQQQKGAIVSAPVSREAPSGDGHRQSTTRVTLTKEQKEYAQIAGITEAEYAKQVLKLQQEKALGNYRESR